MRKKYGHKIKKNDVFFITLLGLLLLGFIILSVFIYLNFLKVEKFDFVDTAEDLRNTALELSIDENHRLDDYDTLHFAPNAIRFNTCSFQTEVLNNEFAWGRDWIYLVLFDSLYADITGDTSYLQESEILLESLYDRYGFYNEDGEIVLEAHDIIGFESFCTPFFVLNDLDNRFGLNKHPKTTALASQLCDDFFDKSTITAFECDPPDSYYPYCLENEELYDELDSVFKIYSYTESDRERLSLFQTQYFYPSFLMLSDYIFAYTHNLEEFIKFTNAHLLRHLDYKKFEIHDFYYETDFSPCFDNSLWYFDLIKSMAVKRNFLEGSHMIERHSVMESEILRLCRDYYVDYNSVVSNQDSIGEKIATYYLLRDYDIELDMDELLLESLRGNFVSRNYNFSKYSFMDINSSLLLEENEKGLCYDKEVYFGDNFKNALYLLIYSIYGD